MENNKKIAIESIILNGNIAKTNSPIFWWFENADTVISEQELPQEFERAFEYLNNVYLIHFRVKQTYSQDISVSNFGHTTTRKRYTAKIEAFDFQKIL
jgi:hypothetical protein